MKLVFFGTPQFAVPSLTQLLHHPDFEVVGVVTQPDKRRGRGSQMIPSAVKKVALDHQLPIWQPPRLKKDQPTLNQLQEANADAFVVVAYGQILSPRILAMPRLGCINLHGSLLPRYRGAAPIQWCLVNGETETGNTTMLMDKGMDTGPMLLKQTTPISLWLNAHQLAETLSQSGGDLLIKTLTQLEQGTIKPIPQDSTLATYAPLIQKSDYKLDWQKSALALHHQIRGFYPNCYTTLQGKKLKIMETIPLDSTSLAQLPANDQDLKTKIDNLSELQTQHPPATVVARVKQWGAVIATGEGYLLLKTVQLAGKKVQSGWDFVNGNHLQIGDRLG